MSKIEISNPNGTAVDVRVVGKKRRWLFGKPIEALLHVSAAGSAQVDVPAGPYTIRYRSEGSKQVYEGDKFDLPDNALIEITLQKMRDGNYGTHAAGTEL